DANGNLITVVQTDSTGRASAVVPPGSMVTLADVSTEPGKTNYVFETILGVMPGDEIVRGVTTAPTLPTILAPTLSGAVENADEYFVYAGCSEVITANPASIASVEITAECVDGGTFDVLAVARDSEGAPLAYSYQLDVPF